MLEKRVRLTKDSDGKVVKIEIYVDEAECGEIFKYFPDTITEWKDAAPHLLVLKALASYEKKQLTTATHNEKNELVAEITQVVKNLCHKTAPLYALINHHDLDDPFHPAREQWEAFVRENPHVNKVRLKIAFIQSELVKYNEAVEKLIEEHPSLASLEGIRKFYRSHQQETKNFMAQLAGLANSVLDEDQLRKLLSNQDEANMLNMTSLGKFLRSQAHELANATLATLDDVVGSRFEQLFSFSAHPLRKEIARVEEQMSKQESTHAIRFLNTRLPIPAGQLAVLKNNGSKSKAESEKRWFDVMPYANCKTFLGRGIEGAEGGDDLDRILTWYANGPQLIKKPHTWFYRKLVGEEGVVGIFQALFLGLPALIMGAVGLVVGACVAMTVDFLACFLQALVFTLCSPLLLVGVIVDFVLQIPSFFTQEIEIKYSLLAEIAKLDIPPESLNKALRSISLVRMFKQYLLNNHDYYQFVEKDVAPESFQWIEQQEGEEGSSEVKKNGASKAEILDRVKENQAEGLFNVAASKLFAFSNVAKFLHEKLKHFLYAARELRKVASMLWKVARHFFSGEVGRIQERQRSRVVRKLTRKVEERMMAEFTEAFKKWKEKPSHDIAIRQEREWRRIVPWPSKQTDNPLDFISDIAAGAVGTVDFAFTEDPGIATLMFVPAIVCSLALLFPAVASVIPAQIVNGLQWVPQYTAKAFMGKSLETGISDIAVNIISTFLQWQLTTYGIKGFVEVYHGNFEWVKKLFEHPEEITLGAATFVSMGYGVGLIPNLPTGVNILPSNSNPFLNTLSTYPSVVYNGFANAFNVVINESKGAAKDAISGLNTLELAFIGLKSSLLIYGLLSGTYEAQITPLNVDFNECWDDYKTFHREYSSANAGEKLTIVQALLDKHKIVDPDANLAKKIDAQFSALVAANQDGSLNRLDSDQVNEPEMSPHIEQNTSQTPEEIFIKKYKDLQGLLELVRNMEVLGMSIDLFDKDDQNVNYQSKMHAEFIYDALFFAFEDYNQAAKDLGLFHKQIDGKHFLHNFYNKHCYAGSSGWHKILFGILLFPVTWLWRGFKYLIGTPSMRHQVKKSFCKDFAMLLQLITDVVAPISRSFLRAVLYSVRMVLGIFLLPLLLVTGGAVLLTTGAALIGTLPVGVYALVKGVQKDSAKVFSKKMIKYFSRVKKMHDAIWQAVLHHPLVNNYYLKWISRVGGYLGTGSLHELNVLKSIGMASLYEYLTSVADTSSENLQRDACQLSTRLAEDPISIVKDRNVGGVDRILDALAQYDKDARERWKPVALRRHAQLAYLAEGFLNGAKYPSSNNGIGPILEELNQDHDSDLAKKLKFCAGVS